MDVIHLWCAGWSSKPTPVDVRPFIQVAGPSCPLPQTPVEIFSLMFTPDIIGHIVTETNRYAAQCLEGTGREWTTDKREIRAYLGFCVLMGIVRLPEIRDYWSRDKRLHYAPIADRISRKRFEEVSRYLHFVDNTTLPKRGEPGFHRLQKVKGLLDMVRGRFKAVYRPYHCLSVDEAMIPFKGESSMYRVVSLEKIQ